MESLSASPYLTEVSIGGMVLLLVNVLLAVAGGIIAWSSRRLVARNDEDHRQIIVKVEELARETGERIDQHRDRVDLRIGALTDAVAAEREARHSSHKGVDDKTWQINTDLKENYAPRREVMRLFGSLAQRLDQQHRDVIERLDGLPCKRPACPGVEKRDE